MEIIKNNKTIKLIFSLIWCFFLIRLTRLLNFDFENLFKILIDIISLCIFCGLIIYLSLTLLTKKKIPKITFLIIYPIIGVIAYYINGFQNDYQESILIHHFITLSSIFLYFALIQSDKIFDYKFNENLLKISLAFCIIFCFVNVIPAALAKIYSYESLRLSSATTIKFFGNEIIFHQNINGQSKFLLIIFMLCFFYFKKFLFNKQNISYLFFTFSVFVVTIIFLTQSRLNILASFVFSFFFLLMIKNLSLRKKLIYFLLILAIPISVFNIYTDKKVRFSNEYKLIYKPFENKNEIINYEINQVELTNKLVEVLTAKKSNIILNDEGLILKDKKLKRYLQEQIILFLEDFEFYKNKIIYNKAYSYHEEYLIDFHTLKIINNIFIENRLTKSSFRNGVIDENFKKMFLIKNFLGSKNDKQKLFILKSCSESIYFIDTLLSGRVCGWEILWNSINLKELILGKGFFADQVFLNPLEKVSSNSFVNIFYNAGIISLLTYLIILIIFFTKFFKIKNINHKNLFFSLSHYLILYFLFRSLFEDTLAFVSVDLLISGLCLSLIVQKHREEYN